MTDISVFTTTIPLQVNRKALERVVIHFAGDSGDGMQLAGQQFTQSCAVIGNDIRTFPDFPAEIRAPQGTLPGVSGFQLSFSEKLIHTPGDQYDVLVAMNPAALKVTIGNLKSGGILIIDEDKFTDKDLKKAGFESNPFEGDTLSNFRVIRLPMTSLTVEALSKSDLSRSKARKCKNMFALGTLYWLYHRSLEETKEYLKERFKDKPDILEANVTALRAGYHFAITAELFAEHYTVNAAKLPQGTYRQITGNQALAFGCAVVASKASNQFLACGYPITPASDILQYLAKYSEFGIKTFQAEDEIAAIGAAIGASFGGSLAIATTSGPGMDLKSESLGLAVMTELPLVVVDVQRAGPSTGMPTKVEQSDLLMALYGRHGECPLPVLACAHPGDCFDAVIEAFKVATKYMTPVILLSDAYLANSAEPWRIPELAEIPEFDISYARPKAGFLPYQRDEKTLSRPWAIPGTPQLMHRIGGLEKQHETGNISYDPKNHQKMVTLRAQKIQAVQNDIPPTEILGKERGKILIVGWGSTYGSIRTAVEELQRDHELSAIHLRWLNPLPPDLKDILKRFEKIVVVELNQGQLSRLLRAEYLVDAQSITKVEGKPFGVEELKNLILGKFE